MFRQLISLAQQVPCPSRSIPIPVAASGKTQIVVSAEAVEVEPIALGVAVVALLLHPKLMPSELARISVAIRWRLIKYFRTERAAK